jgi:NAD(P)-dependent dehydrogenase (short-subunit alcohol dehydrogenase family)
MRPEGKRRIASAILRQLDIPFVALFDDTSRVKTKAKQSANRQILAGFAGFEYGTAYAASKFGVDGWMESLAPEVEPFGIYATVVNPGFFRTELLTKESTNYAEPSIEDYAERDVAQHEFWESQNGQQSGGSGQARPGAADDRRGATAAAAPLPCRR